MDGAWTHENVSIRSRSNLTVDLLFRASLLAVDGGTRLCVYCIDVEGNLVEFSTTTVSFSAESMWTFCNLSQLRTPKLPRLSQLLAVSSLPVNNRANPATVLYLKTENNQLIQLELGWFSEKDWRITNLSNDASLAGKIGKNQSDFIPAGKINSINRGLWNSITFSTTNFVTNALTSAKQIASRSSNQTSTRSRRNSEPALEIERFDDEEFVLLSSPADPKPNLMYDQFHGGQVVPLQIPQLPRQQHLQPDQLANVSQNNNASQPNVNNNNIPQFQMPAPSAPLLRSIEGSNSKPSLNLTDIIENHFFDQLKPSAPPQEESLYPNLPSKK